MRCERLSIDGGSRILHDSDSFAPREDLRELGQIYPEASRWKDMQAEALPVLNFVRVRCRPTTRRTVNPSPFAIHDQCQVARVVPVPADPVRSQKVP